MVFVKVVTFWPDPHTVVQRNDTIGILDNHLQKMFITITHTGGGGTPIHKLYGDLPPFRVWFFDHLLKIFENFL